MKCTFFGHRRIYENIKDILYTILEGLITQEGVTEFYVGKEGDFDRAVRGVLNDLEKAHPHISYTVVCATIPRVSIQTRTPFWEGGFSLILR